MKRRITLSIVLALSIVLVSLTSSDSRAGAQNQLRVIADTGMIKLGPNQILRITVSPCSGNDTIVVRFRRMTYMQSVCSDGVCKSTMTAQNNSTPLLLMPNEAASYDIDATATHEVRGSVSSNRRNVLVTAAIIDTVTGGPTSTSFLETMEDEECGL
jgi:hypothetical protein